jgi:hypothetical protein
VSGMVKYRSRMQVHGPVGRTASAGRLQLWQTLVLAVFAVMLSCLARGVVTAQGGTVEWGAPTNLSNSPTSSTYPAVVADPYGNVHVFWGEDIGGPEVDPLESGGSNSNTIMYSCRKGQTWSEPVDLFFGQGGEQYGLPSVVVDETGTLHLSWQGYKGIYYSSAPAHLAQDAKAWGSAQLVAPSRGDGPHLLAGRLGTVHLVYSAWQDARSGQKDGNVYYASSPDGGGSWSGIRPLSEIRAAEETQGAHPSITADDDGRLHVVWYQSNPPDWVGSSVHYSRSEDGGHTWSVPMTLASREEEERWSSVPEIAALSGSEIHVVWVCGELAQRCHRWSQDGGKSWSLPQQVFGKMHSLAGWDALALDGSGILHWVSQLRYPEALYHSWWTGDRWASLQTVDAEELAAAHYSRLVSSQGSRLSLVAVHQTTKEVWHISGETAAEAIDPRPTPTRLALPAPSPSLAATLVSRIPSPSATGTMQVYRVFTDSPVPEHSEGHPVLVSVLSVFALIVIVGLIRMRAWTQR